MSGPLSPKLDWSLANPKWAATLNPVLTKPINSSQSIIAFSLVAGVNTIPHKLGQQLQGWYITDINAAITLFRSEPFNKYSLTLTASGPATINIEVF
jgi:hypothetical protein